MEGALVGLGAVGGGLWTLFGYNKGVWTFDKGMRQSAIYATSANAISKVGLWREDLRDLFNLVNANMESYQTVSTLVLGYCCGLSIDYTLEAGAPGWIFALGSGHNAAGLAYGMCSMILSMYASVSCQQFLTKTMTEIVRLPIPDAKAINDASAFARTFEDLGNARTMMRVPIVSRLRPGQHEDKQENVVRVSEAPHLELFRSMQRNWLPLANFARLSMICALGSIINTLIYWFLSEHLVVSRQVWGVAFTVFMLSLVNMVMQTMDYILSRREWCLVVICHMVPPVASFVGLVLSMTVDVRAAAVCAPFCFLSHACWCLCILHFGQPDDPDTEEREGSRFRLTLLQEMQFGIPGSEIEEVGTDVDMDSVALSRPLLRRAGSQLSVDTLSSADEDESMVLEDGGNATHEQRQARLRLEVRVYHLAAALHLENLKSMPKGINVGVYEEEFKGLSRWAGEPEETTEVAKTSSSVAEGLQSSAGASCCPAGHQLRAKDGQTIFHVHGRFCYSCLRDFDRTESRYVCDKCFKYDICPRCAPKADSRPTKRRHSSGTVRREDQLKEETMLRHSLKDMRRRIKHLDDCKGRQQAPHRRGHWKSGYRCRESDDGPLEEELVQMLPDPIKTDKLEEALYCESAQDLENLPWLIFRSLVSVIWLFWMLAFIWSIVDAAVPSHDLNKPHDSILSADWMEKYGDWDDYGRRLQVALPDDQSSPDHVAAWLRQAGHERAANQTLQHGIDGETLRYLSTAGWQEMGVESGVERARISRALFGSKRNSTVV